jgi:uncharacterized protein (UPF0216 family)
MTQTDIWSENFISDISDEDMDTFKSLVIKDIKGILLEDEFNVLSSNLELWNYNLQVLRRDMELQLSCQKTKVKLQKANSHSMNEEELESLKTFVDEQDKWRMSALKFLSNIERRSLYVKLLISELKQSPLS